MTEPMKEDVTGRKEPSGGTQVVGEGQAVASPTPEQLEAAGAEIADLEIYWQSGHQYTVWSERDTQQAYHVDLSGEIPTCNCEHGRHNRDSYEACRHIKKAISVGRSRLELDVLAVRDMLSLMSELWGLRDEHRRLMTGHEADRAASKAQEGSDTPDVEEAAERLAEAFEAAGVTHEFEWTSDVTNDGQDRLWFAFDGKVPSGLFSAYIQEPDAVWYQPDDSPDEDKPNSIMVENVDGYIEDVLE